MLSKIEKTLISKEETFCSNTYHPLPVVLKKGKGVFVWDVNNKKYFDYVKLNIDQVSTYELLSPLLALCFGVPGAKKFKQQVNDLIRARDIATLESTYLSLIAA